MSYLIAGAGVCAYMYYKRRSIAYQGLKAYTILEDKYRKFVTTAGIKVIKEIF